MGDGEELGRLGRAAKKFGSPLRRVEPLRFVEGIAGLSIRQSGQSNLLLQCGSLNLAVIRDEEGHTGDIPMSHRDVVSRVSNSPAESRPASSTQQSLRAQEASLNSSYQAI